MRIEMASRCAMLIASALCVAGPAGWGQEETMPRGRSCTDPSFESVPSRPTVTSATDTTQCGVAEVEYGLERQWPGS